MTPPRPPQPTGLKSATLSPMGSFLEEGMMLMGGGALGLAAAVVAWGGARGDWGPGGCGSEAVGRATVCVVVVVMVAVAVGRGGAETTVGSTLWTGVDMAMGCFFSWGRGMRL